jgi:hypothetical protein
MRSLAAFLLLEVMDKEVGIPGLWISALILGAAGFFLARRRWWWAVPILALLAFSAVGIWAEWTDPFVGPGIAAEAGSRYPVHLVASTSLAVSLILVGLITRRQHPNER